MIEEVRWRLSAAELRLTCLYRSESNSLNQQHTERTTELNGDAVALHETKRFQLGQQIHIMIISI